MEALSTWSPAPSLNVTAVEREETRWLVAISSRQRACCPVCGVQSRSRHSFYSRTLGDLSAQGTPVTIRVRVSRWRCRNERCDRQIFAERLPGIAAPSARQTDRLAEIVKLFGHSAGGRPSARLMARLGMRVSHTTIVQRFLAPWRNNGPPRDGDDGLSADQEAPTPLPVQVIDPMTGRRISPLVAAALCVKPRRQMTLRQIVNVDALKASAEFTSMRGLAMRFRGLLRGGTVEKLDMWLKDARRSGIYGMQRFARALRHDIEAVRNAVLRARLMPLQD